MRIKEAFSKQTEDAPGLDLTKVGVVGRGLGTYRRFDLRTLRLALGKTQAEVSSAAGMDQGDVSRLERRKDARLSTLRRYAHALGGQLEVAVVVNGRRYLLDQEGSSDG
jgi:Helix-turn-helix domain